MLSQSVAGHSDFLPGAPEDDLVMDRLHAYGYFLEGMLPKLGQPRCVQSLAPGLEAVAGHLRRIAPRFCRSDAYAQLLRMRLFAEALAAVPLDRLAADEEAHALAAFQLEDMDARIRGGFSFGRRNHQIIPHISPVSTAFAMQALVMWEQYKTKGFETAWQALI